MIIHNGKYEKKEEIYHIKLLKIFIYLVSSVQFSCSVMSDGIKNEYQNLVNRTNNIFLSFGYKYFREVSLSVRKVTKNME